MRVCFYLTIIFSILYSYELTNFNLSIDDEVIAFSPSSHFTEMGRWLHPLIRETLWEQPILPAGGMILFGVMLSLSYFYITKTFGVIFYGLFHFVLWAGFCLFPTWMAQLEFSANIIPVGIGVFTVSVASYLSARSDFLLQRGNVGRIVVASLLCAVAIGAYQSLIVCYLVLTLGWYAANLLKETGDERNAFSSYFGVVLIVLMLSLAIWFIFAKIFIELYGLEVSKYGESFIKIEVVIRDMMAALRIFAEESYLLYCGFWKDFGWAGAIFVSALLVAIVIFSGLHKGYRKAISAIVLIVILLLPTSICFVSGEFLPLRTFIAAPMSIGVVFLAAHEGTRQGSHRLILLVAALLVALQGLYINSVYQARSWAVQKHDLLLAASINSEVMNLGMRNRRDLTEIDFHGFIKPKIVYPEIPTTAGGGSFFEWDGGKPYRMVRYLHMIGYNTYSMTTPEKQNQIRKYYAGMPAFPEKGYAKVVDNVVLVKLSD